MIQTESNTNAPHCIPLNPASHFPYGPGIVSVSSRFDKTQQYAEESAAYIAMKVDRSHAHSQ